MSGHSFTRRVALVSFLFLLFVALVIPSFSLARDPHPRKVRVKNESGAITWGTPVVYGSLPGQRLIDEVGQNEYCQPGVWDCDCFFKPEGPINTWVKIDRASNPEYGDQCYAPPYTTSGEWWTWLEWAMQNKKNQLQPTLAGLVGIGIYLGIDGEARPLKSGDGWRRAGGGADADMTGQFRSVYVPAVVGRIRDLYPGKTLRSHTDAEFKDRFLENGIDFHRESLAADEQHAYLYMGLQWTGLGWWQGFADHFWVTNSLGLGQGWPPLYITTLSALSKHTDSMTGGLVPGNEKLTSQFVNWAISYMGRDVRDTPGVWTHLRDTAVRKKEWFIDWGNRPACGQTERIYESFADNYSGKYGDYDFYLYRPEKLEANQTVPVRGVDLPAGTANQIYTYRATNSNYVDTRTINPTCDGVTGTTKTVTSSLYVGRKVAPGRRYMSFDVDDGYAYRFAGQPGVSYDFRIVYLDQGTATFKLQYKNEDGQWQEKPVTKTNTNLWKEVSINVTDAVLNNNASEGSNASLYPTDFRLDFGNPIVPTVIHLVEVRGKEGMVKEEIRPKAQIAVDLIRNQEDDPKQGIYSMGLNQTFWVKATLRDEQKRPIPNERIMFTYNTEWNLAKSAITDASGKAYVSFSTANNPNSSGFIAGGETGYKASSYSVQAYFPGSEQYQPSRNDAKLWMTDSPSPTDPRNLRMEILSISSVQPNGKVTVTYRLHNRNGRVGGPILWPVGQNDGFYADDPNAQTVSIFGLAGDHFSTSNHVTLYGNRNGFPSRVEDVQGSSSANSGRVTLTWRANPETDIAGYRVYYGPEPGKYNKSLGVRNTNSATISGLENGKAYYFVVAAHNKKAFEGDLSKEVSKTAGVANNELTVIRSGTGTGTVTGNGIQCGGDCQEPFAPGATVTLTAAADAESTFVGWSGACTGAGSCTLVMNSNKTSVAQFSVGSNPSPSYKITATAGGGGMINPQGEVTVNAGANQTFTITPDAGYYIIDVQVDGISKGASSIYTFSNVMANHTIAATFSVLSNNQYALTIDQTGGGTGTVISSPSGPLFNAGTVVTLTATASAGSVFDGWSGACTGASSACTVTMNANRSVAATFTVKDPSIDPKRGIYDMDGDGKAEILWQHQTQGDVYVWYMDGANLIRDEHIATISDDLSWKIVGVGDFNGDGKPDILWHHQTRGEVYVWFMDGPKFLYDQHIRTVGDDLSWKIVGVGDFNGDGKADILWHHQQRGEVYVWFMDGPTFVRDQHIRTISDDLSWKIVGVGDFNGDGKPDILWHHQTRGEVYVWYMDGATFLYDKYIRTVPEIEWQIEAVGDYNGDGKPDILWRNQRTGEIYVWFMDGATFVRDQLIRLVEDRDWKIVN